MTDKQRAEKFGEAMRLMAEAVELAWKRDAMAASKVSNAILIAHQAVEGIA